MLIYSKNQAKLSQVITFVFIFINLYVIIVTGVTYADDDVQYSKKTYTYKIADGNKIQADVYDHLDNKIRPLILWIHGGALIFGSRNWLPTEQLTNYLRGGYNVVAIDYRLAPETKLSTIIEDLIDAYHWVRTEGPSLFNIDPDRIAVVGHSAGGYLTLMAGFCLDPRPKALVSFYGYGNITGPWYSQADSFYNQRPAISKKQAFAVVGDSIISGTPTENSWRQRLLFYFYCRQQGLWPQEVCGHDPHKEKEWFSDYEPLRNVTSEYPPTLLLHGKKDNDVPYNQSFLMAETFKRHHIKYEFITNPEWGHGFDDAGMEDPTVHEAFDHIFSFLNTYLKKSKD
jgi:acetyl esterase/lipase